MAFTFEDPYKKKGLLFGNLGQAPFEDQMGGANPMKLFGPSAKADPMEQDLGDYGDQLEVSDETSMRMPAPEQSVDPLETIKGSETQPKPSRFKRLLFGETTGGGVDEYGLQRPTTRRTGLMGALLKALPATIYGATQGLGLTGLGVGLGAAGNQIQKQNEELENDYRTERAEKIKAAKPSAFQQKLTEFMNLSPDRKKAYGEMHSIENPTASLNYNLSLDKYKSDQADRKIKQEKEALGEKLPAGQAVLLADGANIPSLLDNLEKTLTVKKDVGGPIEGRIRGLNPYDTPAQDFQSQLNATKQFVGKFLEGGVLRKEDESKYDKIMPLLTDTPEVRQAKLANLRKMVQEKQNEYLDSFKKAGYNVSNYSSLENSSAGMPAQTPQGATGKVKGSDGNWYWTDGKNNLGRAQ